MITKDYSVRLLYRCSASYVEAKSSQESIKGYRKIFKRVTFDPDLYSKIIKGNDY